MKCHHWFRAIVTMATVGVGVFGKFYRESVHRSFDLLNDDVTINVISEIPGTLKWVTTDRNYLTITVKVSAATFDVLNSTDIFFTSTNTSVSLDIRTSSLQEPAAVYSTGSRYDQLTGSTHVLIVLLLWVTAVVVDWRCGQAMMMLCVLQTLVTGHVDTGSLSHGVDIVIKAPRNFRYKSIKLAVNNGTVNLTDEIFKSTQEVHCSTDLTNKGCGKCCHGHGICFNNTCICEENYEKETNCRTMTKRDVLFVNSFDPRISKTILPNGVVLDLSKGSNSKDYKQRGKGQDQSKLHIRNQDGGSKEAVLHFDESGFLKRFRRDKVAFVLRRRKHQRCHITVLLKIGKIWKGDFVANLCNTSAFETAFNGSANTLKRHNANKIRQGHTSYFRNNKYISKARRHSYEIPIKYERCGYDTQNDVFIYFKVFDVVEEEIKPRHHRDDIFLHTIYRRDRHFLELPLRNITNNTIQGQCQRSMEVRKDICRSDFLTLYSSICDSINAHESINNSQTDNISNAGENALSACNFLVRILTTYCPSITWHNDETLENTPCLSRYTKQINLFANDQLTLRPIVVSQNGESIIKEDVIIVPKETISNSLDKEILLKENIPEFKILDVSVIPKDPVPQDIYKVRMDYACATNQTVIKMNVTGSDKYSSHVTCHGVTECNCCSVHAAGAADAVIDYVTISITDELANTNIHREMVVIF